MILIYMDLEHLDSLYDMDDSDIVKIFELISRENYIRSSEEDIFPNFYKDYLPISLESKIPIDKELYTRYDEIQLSITANILTSIKYSTGYVDKSELVDNFHEKLAIFKRWISNNKRNIYFEDSKKRSILLFLPSERQFRNVRGNWSKWLWKDTTYKGDITPTLYGWLNDILNLVDTFKKLGIRSIVAVDKEAEDILNENYEGQYITLDVPPNLPKIGYTRDQSVTWFEEPIIGSMAISLREGEEEVIYKTYLNLGIEPIYVARWWFKDGYLYRSKMEGGNYIFVDTGDQQALFTGVGVRGSNIYTFRNLDILLPENIRIFGVPISGYIRRWISGAVHLDVVMMYIGLDIGLTILDPSRMGIYSILEYDRRSKSFTPLNGFEVFRELNLKILEPPFEKDSRITMVNALNLGDGKLIVDSYNRSTNKYLTSLGLDLIEVDIPHIEAGGGGVRCATREIWI